MLPLNQRIGEYITKYPKQKLMIHHGDMVFTFHNAKIIECMWFAIKTLFQRKQRGSAQADTDRQKFVVDTKTRQASIIHNHPSEYKHPSELNLVGRIMSQFKRQGEINPNKKPPRGKKIKWDESRGYHYVSKAGEQSTFNRWIKSKNSKPEGD